MIFAPDFGPVASWLNANTGVGAWVQGLGTFASIVILAVLSLKESRLAYRMHLEALNAQLEQEQRRLRGLQVAALHAAEFASDRFRRATDHAKNCDGLRGIDNVWSPDFDIVISMISSFRFGELQDRFLIEHLGQIAISSESMKRHLKSLDMFARNESLTDDERATETGFRIALMAKEAGAIRHHTDRVARELGFVREAELRKEGPTTKLTIWNRTFGRALALLRRTKT